MLKRLTNMVVMAIVLSWSASAAQAKPQVERAQLNVTSTGRIIVVAEDGKNYSKIATENLKFDGNVDVKMKSGELEGYSVFFGVCAGRLCGTSAFKNLHSNSFSSRKALKENVSFELSADQIPQGLSNNVQASDIFTACNEKARDRTAEYAFDRFLKMTLTLNFSEKKVDSNSGDYADDRDIQVRVICRAIQPKPISVDLKVSQKGNVCPKETEVRALIKYREKATAKFYFKVDGKLSKQHEITARKVDDKGPTGLGTFLVERVETYHLDPGNHTFSIVIAGGEKSAVKTVNITCPPFKVNSMWLTYDVQHDGYCPKDVKEELKMRATRPGTAPFRIKTQAGLIVHSGAARFERKGLEYVAVEKRNVSMSAFDSDMMAEIEDDPSANSGWTHLLVECLERLNAELTVRDTTTSTKCPRKGSVKVKLGFNMFKEKVRYRVDCTSNRSWTRDTISKKSRSGSEFGVTDYLDFDVKKTEQVNCALKDMYDGGKVIAVAGHNFKCVIPTQDTPGEMTQDTLPPEAPDAPHTGSNKVVVDPPREPRTPQLDVIDPGKPEKSDDKTTDSTPDHSKPGGKGASDVTPDYGKNTRYDEEADKKRLEALKRKQALEARKEAEARHKRAEAAKKAAEEARRKRAEAAKKAAEEARHKRAEAAKKAAEEAQRKRAEAAKKVAEEARSKREAANKRRKSNTGNVSAGMRTLRRR